VLAFLGQMFFNTVDDVSDPGNLLTLVLRAGSWRFTPPLRLLHFLLDLTSRSLMGPFHTFRAEPSHFIGSESRLDSRQSHGYTTILPGQANPHSVGVPTCTHLSLCATSKLPGSRTLQVLRPCGAARRYIHHTLKNYLTQKGKHALQPISHPSNNLYSSLSLVRPLTFPSLIWLSPGHICKQPVSRRQVGALLPLKNGFVAYPSLTRIQTATTSVPGYACSRAHSQSCPPSQTSTS